MEDKQDVLNYILQKKSIFTVESTKVNRRITYMFIQYHSYVNNTDKNYWNMYYLFGPENTKDYRHIGLYYNDTKLMSFDPSCAALPCGMIKEFMRILLTNKDWPQSCKFYRSTKCSRCGRKLTTPESIKCGCGPKCGKRERDDKDYYGGLI